MSSPFRFSAAARLAAVLAGVMCSMVAGSSVSAHTDLEFTLPTDDAAVGEPVSEITVGFDDPVTLVGPGFEVLDPQGRTLTPFAVTDDDTVFRLQLDPPIGGGEAAVRYEVRAEDGHTISGGFSFTVSADAPTTTVTATTTPAPTTTAPTTTAATIVSTSTSTSAPDPTVATTTSLVPATPPRSPDGPGDDGARSGAVAAAAAVVAVAAGGFLVVRSRRSPES